jgi:hypothetical protein
MPRPLQSWLSLTSTDASVRNQALGLFFNSSAQSRVFTRWLYSQLSLVRLSDWVQFSPASLSDLYTTVTSSSAWDDERILLIDALPELSVLHPSAAVACFVNDLLRARSRTAIFLFERDAIGCFTYQQCWTPLCALLIELIRAPGAEASSYIPDESILLRITKQKSRESRSYIQRFSTAFGVVEFHDVQQVHDGSKHTDDARATHLSLPMPVAGLPAPIMHNPHAQATLDAEAIDLDDDLAL